MARRQTVANVEAAAVPAEELEGEFPDIDLPVRAPFPPMEAESEAEIPSGPGWLYEPKWDGFRCLAFRKGSEVLLQSKAGQPLGRYFPELVEALGKLPAKTFVLDGEIVIPEKSPEGKGFSFDALLQRIHPAESRIRKLAQETPASLYAFDLLVDDRGRSLVDQPLEERRRRLETFFRKVPEGAQAVLSPATPDRKEAGTWFGGSGLDGVVAKRLDSPYLSGERVMVKVKRMRTADCVVGGFRWAQKGGQVGSLLLGLYNGEGLLDHVGFSSSFSAEEKKELEAVLKPHIDSAGRGGFTGKAPGGPSRWSQGRSTEWVPLDPVLVCEVRYDHFSGGRFRHGTKFLRWRPEKKPKTCTYDQIRPTASG
jgi:ATP-dependent DNA ligase